MTESSEKVNEEGAEMNEIIDLALLDLENKEDILQESTLDVCYSPTDLPHLVAVFFFNKNVLPDFYTNLI